VALQQAGRVVRAYWGYVAAVEAVSVREGDAAQAERLLRDNEERLAIGVAAANEVKQARSGLAIRRAALSRAELARVSAEDALKEAMGWTPGSARAGATILPVDAASLADVGEHAPPDLRESIARAMARRPEIAVQALALANRGVTLAETANGRLPALDLVLSATHDESDVTAHSRSLAGTAAAAWSKDARDDATLTAGVRASYPLGNRSARHAHRRARLEQDRAEQEAAELEKRIAWDVKEAFERVALSVRIVRNTDEAVTFARANLEAERERLNLGVSTSFRVLQLQQDLTESELEAVRARTGLATALADLRLAEGVLLESLGVDTGELEG
jgi:outer membrane protein TolC